MKDRAEDLDSMTQAGEPDTEAHVYDVLMKEDSIAEAPPKSTEAQVSSIQQAKQRMTQILNKQGNSTS